MSNPSPERSALEASLQKTYGDGILYDLNELKKRHPDTPAEQLVETIRQHPTPTATRFFRNKNLTAFATEVAPQMARALGKQTLRIGQIACSKGDETWSLAALLEQQGVDYTIYATDINPDVLAEARTGVYPDGAVAVGRDDGPAERKAAKLFKHRRGTDTSEPDRKLHQRVAFAQHDILAGPLPGGPYHALFVNNMLYHYPEQTRDKIIENITGSLAVDGVLVFENNDGPGHGTYIAWASDLKNSGGLVPFESAGAYQSQIRQYNPSAKKHTPRVQYEDLPTIASSADGSLLQQVGATVADTVYNLPGDVVHTAIDHLHDAADILYAVSSENPFLQDTSGSIYKAVIKAQDAITSMHGASYHMRAYLGDIGITNENE
jgi:chemotaxis methyl-accepting protein methylase